MRESQPNLLPNIDEEELISPTRLLNALYYIANRSSRFKRGERDGVEFEVAYCDRLEPGAFDFSNEELGVGEESEGASPEITYYHYKFFAQRLRFEGERPFVAFTFSTWEKHDNVELPELLDKEELDVEGAEPCSRIEKMNFNMRSDLRQLSLYESVIYEDEDDDLIADYNSYNVDFLGQDENGDDGSQAANQSGRELSVATAQGQYVLSEQKMEASELWLDQQLEDNKLRRAYRALQNIERALLEQAGVL